MILLINQGSPRDFGVPHGLVVSDTEHRVVAAGAISALLLVAAGGATSGAPGDFAMEATRPPVSSMTSMFDDFFLQ